MSEVGERPGRAECRHVALNRLTVVVAAVL